MGNLRDWNSELEGDILGRVGGYGMKCPSLDKGVPAFLADEGLFVLLE